MKFSVLIAHYNNAVFFKECYNSLINQSYQTWEAIILDDASKAVEIEIIKKIIEKDNRFIFHKNQTNSGVGVTKSKLIELANGEICGFVDPDDAIMPNAIEKAIEIFKKNKKTVLTYSRFMRCDENLTPISPFKSAMQVPNKDPYFFNFPVQIAHFVCFRKEKYMETAKMNPELKISEDQDLYLKLYEKGNVKFIPETNYLYRTHIGGISQNNHKKKSYEYFGKVIWDAMQRRNLEKINGKNIPKTYTNSQEIFDLLSYQNSVNYRIKKKIKIFLQRFFLN